MGEQELEIFFVTEMIFSQGQQKHIFWKSVHPCVCKERSQVSDMFAFIELSENITDFEVYKWWCQN